MSYGTAWHKILQANLLAGGFDLNDFLYAGPNSIHKCASRLTNEFWKEVLGIFAKLTSSIMTHRPHYFYHLNLFDNDLIKYGGNLVRKYDFPMLWSKNIRQVGDLYDCNMFPPRLMDRLELNRNYFLNLDFLRFHQLKSSIQLAAQNFGKGIFDPGLSDNFLPRLPLLFKISLEQLKGCQTYYQVLRSNVKAVRGTINGENKWHDKIGAIYPITFWDKIYKISQDLLLPNKQIWTQIQINKYLLPTNYSVNMYDKNVSPQCSYCSQHLEKLHLLMWDCEVVKEFWNMIQNLISNFYPHFKLGKKEAFFGDVNSKGNSIINTILAIARYFIYQQKFLSKELDEVKFINYIRDHLSIILQIKKSKNKEIAFLHAWNVILEHFQVP